MSCKSAIFTINNTAVDINLTEQSPSATLPLGNVVRRFGQNLQMSGNGINIYDPCNNISYYDIDSSVTITTPTAGNYTVAIQVDGVTINQQVFTTVANATVSFNVPALTRLNQFSDTSIVTLVLTTTATLPVTVTLNNASLVVERI